MREFDAAVFTMKEFVPPDFPISNVDFIPPAIDPLSPKNMPLADDTSRRVLQWIGIDLDRPLITQVSRFDPWKDPLGVIQVYRILRNEFPRLQLALVASMALDDPEGWTMYRRIMEDARRDPDIHVLTNLVGVGNVEVNAFQRFSQAIIQKSIREGFGLVVSEAMWKSTPVVAGKAGGIPLQMADGVGGMLVENTAQCASALRQFLLDPDLARDLAHQGRERVRRYFLLPRLILDELRLMRELAAGLPAARDASWRATRDPVCGMPVRSDDVETTVGGQPFHFCSEGCRNEFIRRPQNYLAA
jgi:trehalose synthase